MHEIFTSMFVRIKARAMRPRFLHPFSLFEYRNKIIFIHIPKNAGTSLSVAINGVSRPRVHARWLEYQNRFPKRFENSFKFCVVREPTERFESALNYILSGGNGKKRDKEIERYVREKIKESNLFLPDTIAYLKENFNIFRPQLYFICDDDGALKIDKLYSIYNMSALSKDLQRYNIKFNAASFVNKAEKKFTLSDDQRKVLEVMYRDDFVIWDAANK